MLQSTDRMNSYFYNPTFDLAWYRWCLLCSAFEGKPLLARHRMIHDVSGLYYVVDYTNHTLYLIRVARFADPP
jgi:hypothetical protein